jgi:hypothetical protein
MRLRILTTAALLALLAILAPQASADPVQRQLNVGSEGEFAVGEGFAYWSDPHSPTCGHCNRLMRTDLATGAVTMIAHFPERIEIEHVRAAGDTVAFTKHERRHEVLRTELRSITLSGVQRTIAKGTFFYNRRARCGDDIVVGAVSPQGEVAWQTYTDPHGTKRKCGALDDDIVHMKIVVGAQSQSPGGRVRTLQRPTPFPIFVFANATSETGGTTILALQGDRAMLMGIHNRAAVVDRAAGTSINYPVEKGNYLAPPLMKLAGNGAVLRTDGKDILFENTVEFHEFPVLYPNAGDSKTHINLYAQQGLVDSEAVFCGDKIVQVTRERPQPAVTLRDMNGALLETLTPSGAPADEYLSNVDCDSKTLVLRYSPETFDDTQDWTKAYAIDLP